MNRRRSFARRILAAAAVLLVLATASAAWAIGPLRGPVRPRVSAPVGVRAKAGSTGTLALVSWDPAPGVAGYRIWRSTRSLAGFEPVGSTVATSFADASGVPNRTYYYEVTAIMPEGYESQPSTSTAGVRPDWNLSPHATYGKGDNCMTCHAQHSGEGGPSGGEVAVCYSCHDGQGARTNILDGATDSFALASGHRVEESTRTPDLTNKCSSCHSPHADPRRRPGLYAKRIRGLGVTGGNTWCVGCHDDGSTWSRGYPGTGAPVRDGKGYPVLGTYPGPAAYVRTASAGHAGIVGTAGGPKGDCLLCHAAHRGPNAYDGLLMQFRPSSGASVAGDQSRGTFAQLCLNCHSGRTAWAKQGAADIARYVTRTGPSGYAGHSIVTSGGTLPVGAPVPCYDCHNPHGSSRGNASLISDALGERLSTAQPSAVREFCFSCHSSADGKVWDSAKSEYASAGAAKFEGLRRDGSDGSVLRLAAATGAHASTSAESCYSCHGSDYGRATSFNVHAPDRRGAGPAAQSGRAPIAPSSPGKDKTATIGPAAAD